MRNIKKIFTLVLSLILLFAIGCDTESKTGGKVTPPSEPETPTEEGDFPPPAGGYKSDARRLEAGVFGSYREPKVSYDETTKKTKIDGDLILHGSNTEENNGRYESRNAEFNVSKWRKTTKDGKITKTEAVVIEPYTIIGNGKPETPTFTEVIYDYETKTLSITCKVTIDGIERTLSTKSELKENI